MAHWPKGYYHWPIPYLHWPAPYLHWPHSDPEQSEPGCIDVLTGYCTGAEIVWGVTGATFLAPTYGYPLYGWPWLGWPLVGTRLAYNGCVGVSVTAPEYDIFVSMTPPGTVRIQTCQ